MREIKFRAKTIDGVWFYWKVDSPINMEEMKEAMDWNTLGEFTGLLDRNGVEIYEGDVVLFTTRNVTALISYHADTARFICKVISGVTGIKQFQIYRSESNLQVVGNRFENPELLEKTKE